MNELFLKAKRAIRFLFYKDISIVDQIKISKILDDEQLEQLFWKMSKADRHHSLEVLERTMKNSNNENLLKLSLLHDIGKSISEYNWLFRIMAELKLVTNRKAFNYLNHEDIGYDLLKENIDDPDISKYYFDNLLTEKNEILEKYEQEAEKVENQYKQDVITEAERKQKIIEIWNEATDKVQYAMSAELESEEFNPVDMMVKSGARGNMMQVRQLAGMRGLVANPKGDIIERPIKSNFREGMSVLEYFISTHGARKGLADTALRTADSGYLTRRLVDVAAGIDELNKKGKENNES